MALLPFEYTNYIAVQENQLNEALEWRASIVVKKRLQNHVKSWLSKKIQT